MVVFAQAQTLELKTAESSGFGLMDNEISVTVEKTLLEGTFQNSAGRSLDMHGRWIAVSNANESPPGTANRTGIVYIFERTRDGDLIERQQIIPSDLANTRFFGTNIRFVGDRLYITSASRDPQIFVYERDENDEWQQAAVYDDPSDEDFSSFGNNLVVEGNLIVSSNRFGQVFYRFGSSDWQELTVPDFDGELAQAIAVLGRDRFSGGGSRVLVISDTHIHMMQINFSSVNEVEKFELPVGRANNNAWHRLEASGSTFAFSRTDYRDEDNPDSGIGIVYVYERRPDRSWQNTAVLQSPDGAEGIAFGTSLRFYANRLLVGDNSRHKAYIYTRLLNGNWEPRGEFILGGASSRAFGTNSPAIGISDNSVVLGNNNSLDGRAKYFEYETDFPVLAYYNNALPNAIGNPTISWFRLFNFYTPGFFTSGRTSQGAETRMYATPNPGQANIFDEDGVFVTDLHAANGGINWLNLDEGEPIVMISGFPSNISNPAEARLMRSGNPFQEISSNLPQIAGVSAWADLTGNGKKDLVLSGFKGVNTSPERVTRILAHTGDFQFEEIEVPGMTQGAAAAVFIEDFFKRGKKDILLVGVSGAFSGNQNIYLRNLGNGQFEVEENELTYSGNTIINSAVIGDITNNGYPDIVMGGWADNSETPLGYWFNNGDGTFGRINFWPTPLWRSFSVSMQLVDITNNGRLDLIYNADSFTEERGKTFMVENRLNEDGSVSYLLSEPLLPAPVRGRLKAGDMTGDGKVEMVALGTDELGNSVFRSYENLRPTQMYDRPSTVENVGFTINKNGRLAIRWDAASDDIAQSQSLTYNVSITEPGASEQFSSILQPNAFPTGRLYENKPGNAGWNTEFEMPHLPNDVETVQVRVSAINHHGDNSTYSAAAVWRTDNRLLQLSNVNTPLSRGRSFPAWVDVNANGNFGLAVENWNTANSSSNSISVFEFSDGVFEDLGIEISALDGIWADFTNNGYPDVMANSGDRLRLWENTEGSFSGSTQEIEVEINMMLPADLNNNGLTDIVIANGSFVDDDSSAVLLNMGDGTFEYSDAILPPALRIDVADYNKNGCMDLLVSTIDSGDDAEYVIVYENNCMGHFLAADTVLTYAGIGEAYWADFTGNGYPDVSIMATQEGSNSDFRIALFANNGTAGFEHVETYNGFGFNKPHWIDITGNGYLDLIINEAKGQGARTTALLNNGNSEFDFVENIGLEEYRDGMLIGADVFRSGVADLYAVGMQGNSRAANFYRNFSAAPYQPASAPGNLNAELDDDLSVVLTWSPGEEEGSTPNSGLTYNLRVGTEPGGNDIVSGLALEDGTRLVARSGNMGGSATFELHGLEPNTTYYWSVQAIDNIFNGSEFAEEQSFSSTGTSTETSEELPKEIMLSQNYPNPFNPTTQIDFALPSESHIQISVYDITGRRVAVLANGSYAAGHHQVSFNGAQLASGLYLYRLQTDSGVLTRKMMLIK